MKKLALAVALVLTAPAALAATRCPGTNAGRNDNTRLTAPASPAPTAKPSGSSNTHAGVRH